MYAFLRHLEAVLPRRVRRLLGPPGRRLLKGPHVWPHFVIAGAQKAGTTSLYRYISQHPQVMPATRKEVHFFDVNYHRGPDWYRAHFPRRGDLRRRADKVGRPVITGEASPYYLFHPHAARRLAETIPEAKLIVLLRDPVARAYSHYQHQVRFGRETLDFEEALAREAERIDGELERMLADPSYVSLAHRHFSYATRGLYADQLEVLFRFVPREHVLVLSSERLFEHTQQTFDEVARFLRLPPLTLTETKPYNRGAYRPDIPGERALRAFYEPHNRRLYDLCGMDFEWDTVA